MKRFWDSASVAEVRGGYGILLDGRPMRLPGGRELTIPVRQLAEAIAGEWQAAGGGKGGEMSFADTPLTRLAGTAQDRIAPNRAATVDALVQYGESDLLCYRAAAPAPLVARQMREWQPWLDWAALKYDAPLRVTTGIRHITQEPQALSALRAAVANHDALLLAGLGIAVPSLGSLVLGLALAEGAIDAVTAHELGVLDELFQEELWGSDAEAMRRRAGIAADIALAARFMSLAQGGDPAETPRGTGA